MLSVLPNRRDEREDVSTREEEANADPGECDGLVGSNLSVGWERVTERDPED